MPLRFGPSPAAHPRLWRRKVAGSSRRGSDHRTEPHQQHQSAASRSVQAAPCSRAGPPPAATSALGAWRGARRPSWKPDARGDDHQPDGCDRIASQLPSRHDQRRPVVPGVVPSHAPVGVVAQWRVGEPTEVGRTSLSGKRHSGRLRRGRGRLRAGHRGGGDRRRLAANQRDVAGPAVRVDLSDRRVRSWRNLRVDAGLLNRDIVLAKDVVLGSVNASADD